MDGQIEVVNRTLVQLLRGYCGKHPKSLDEHIEYIQHAYNREIHSSIMCLRSKRMKKIHLRKRKSKMKNLLKRLGKFI